MAAITLRNLDPELFQLLRRRADEEGTSLNKVVQQLLHQALGLARSAQKYDDLDHHIGAWTKEQGEEFDQALEEQRRIDPELWT